MNVASEAIGMPSARIVGRESKRWAGNHTKACFLGENIEVNPTHLGMYCSSEMDARADDLIVLAGMVAYADRRVRRATSRTWARRIELSIPVLDVPFWQQSQIGTELHELLNLLTGDAWHISFTQRRGPLKCEPQTNLALVSATPPKVMPYSDGMDSFAVARLFNKEDPLATLIMVTTGRRKDADAASEKGRSDSKRLRFAVPFRVLPGRSAFREMSYRSRALVYATMGAIASAMSGAKAIIVAESGQGALGPWLAPVGNEADDLRMHPLLTTRMAAFMGKVLDTALTFEHPRLWSTKAQTLRELVEQGAAEGVQDTRSCARDSRDVSHNHRLRQCGVCAACLLRRVSMREADVVEGDGTYIWSDLSAATMDESALMGFRSAKKNDMDQARCGVLAMQQLSEVSAGSLGRRAWELARVLDCTATEVEAKLRCLVDQHTDEWKRFLDAQGRHSFLRSWT